MAKDGIKLQKKLFLTDKTEKHTQKFRVYLFFYTFDDIFYFGKRSVNVFFGDIGGPHALSEFCECGSSARNFFEVELIRVIVYFENVFHFRRKNNSRKLFRSYLHFRQETGETYYSVGIDGECFFDGEEDVKNEGKQKENGGDDKNRKITFGNEAPYGSSDGDGEHDSVEDNGTETFSFKIDGIFHNQETFQMICKINDTM